MKRLFTLFVVIMAMLTMALPLGMAQELDPLAGTAWKLVSMGGEDTPDTVEITLQFDAEGRAGGSGGCNSYGGSYTVDGDSIAFSQVASTLMACLEGEVMQLETAYFNALHAATSYELTEGQLVITYGDDQTLIFESLSTIGDTAWQMVSIAGEDVVDGSELTLEFDLKGLAGGTGGCNTFSTAYSADGDTIAFEPVVSTRRACLDEALGQQEQAYFRALESAVAYEVADNQLTITYDDGEQLVFVQIMSLVNTSWELVSIGGSDVIEDTSITLQFDDKGNAMGSGGCNHYGASYIVEGSSIRFNQSISTEMACLQDGVMQQEAAYYEALQSATGYEVSAEQLIIVYGDGQQLVFTPSSVISSMESSMPVVTVEVMYLERMALTPDAEIQVQLLDVSRMDAPAVVIAEETITAEGRQVPFFFELAYDPAQIEERNTYAVRAEIRQGGALIFTTDQSYPVITRGNPDSVTVRVVRVS
jgi:heat shock protein HslJ